MKEKIDEYRKVLEGLALQMEETKKTDRAPQTRECLRKFNEYFPEEEKQAPATVRGGL